MIKADTKKIPRDMGEIGWVNTRAKIKPKNRNRIFLESDVKVMSEIKIRMVPTEKGDMCGSIKCKAGKAMSREMKAVDGPNNRDTKM